MFELKVIFVVVCREEAQEYIEIGALNGLFVLGRSMGFIGKYTVYYNFLMKQVYEILWKLSAWAIQHFQNKFDKGLWLNDMQSKIFLSGPTVRHPCVVVRFHPRNIWDVCDRKMFVMGVKHMKTSQVIFFQLSASASLYLF